MLYYDLINEKDGVDYGEGKDMVRTTKNISRQCQCCNFYYFVTQNLNDINTSAMDVFFAKYTNKTAKD